MSNGNTYYVGAPVQAVERAAPGTMPGPQQVTGGEQDPPPGSNAPYYTGPPMILEEMEKKPASPPPPPAKKNKSSFLAKCVPCLFGGGASSEQ